MPLTLCVEKGEEQGREAGSLDPMDGGCVFAEGHSSYVEVGSQTL